MIGLAIMPREGGGSVLDHPVCGTTVMVNEILRSLLGPKSLILDPDVRHLYEYVHFTQF